MINRGSEWARWDLHVHTKGTAKNDKFGNISFDEYCVELFKKAIENNIKVIGITDYFSIDNFKKVISFQKTIEYSPDFTPTEKQLISNIFILPNVELRTTPSTNQGSAINFHLIIDPSAIDEYEQRFTDHLTFTVSTTEKYKLSRYDLAKLGRKVEQNASLDEEVAIKKGISSFVLNPSDIINAFNEYPSFRDRCIVAVANSNTDGASAFQGHEKFLNSQEGATLKVLRESLYKVSDAIFSAIDKEFFLGKKASNQEAYIQLYGSHKPCIHGSDAHSLGELFNPYGNRFCWIKAEPTFEGLKQILHEPETRVHIGPTKPELKNDYEVIDHIELSNPNIFNQKIYFNPNLTSIIGGRSSGKSTLLQCLAKKLRPESLNRDEKYDHLDSLCADLKIFWKDGNQDDSRPIEYFYQGHMYKKSKGEGIEEIVKNLLLQQNQKLFDEFNAEIAKIKHENSGLLSDCFSIKSQIIQKNLAFQTLGKLEDVIAQINALSEKINEFQSDEISEQDLKDHDQQKSYIKDLEFHISEIENLIEHLSSIQPSSIVTITNPFVNFNAYPIIKNSFEQTLENIKSYAETRIQAIASESIQSLKDQSIALGEARKALVSQESFIKISDFLSRTESLKPILVQKEQELIKASQITKVQDEIKQLNQQHDVSMNKCRENWLSMFDQFKNVLEIINDFNVGKDLSINPSIEFESVSFSEFLRKFINQQSEVAQKYSTSTVSSSEELLNLFDDILVALNGVLRFKQGSDLQNFTKEFFDRLWFKFKYDVEYDGDNYNSMSQGKKAFVVLKMSLDCSESKCPIIIDQPEDDLDNRAIYTELVAYIKTKKSKRQIILVTHNANVVVNADSELVVVANQHGSHSPNNLDKKFQYKYGSIECLTKSDTPAASTLDKMRIKEHICEILEGGDKAFKLREKKYNLN